MSFLKHVRGDGLKARSIRGTGFVGLSFVAQNALRLGGNLVLTRILFPEAFGLMALVQIVITGLTMFSDMGIRVSIIKDARGEDPVYLDTAWTLQILRGALLWAITWALALPVAAFYEEPVLAQMLPVAGLTALIQGFNSTKMATQNRAMALGRMTAVFIGTQAAGLAVTIALALWMGSVWALVWGGLVGPFLLALLTHLVLPGHPNRMRLEGAAARNILGFGTFIFLSSAATFITMNADRAILGKFVSLEELALYNIGFFLATVPMLLLKRLVDGVLFPLYTARPPKDDPANLRKIGRSRSAIILFALVSSICLGAIGVPVITFLYDPRYEAAGPLMVLIAIAQLPEILTTHYGTAIMASGTGRRLATFLILVAVTKTLAMLWGAMQFGVVGVILAPAVAMVLLYPVAIAMVRPYRVWLPGHDAAFLLLSATGSVGVLWLNWGHVLPLLQRLAP